VSANTAAQITVAGIPDEPDKVGDVFIRLSRSEIDAQIIGHSAPEPSAGRSDVTFTVPASQSISALAVLHAAQAAIGFQEIRHNDHVGKVSLEGLGMRSSPEVFSKFFRALSTAGIDLDLFEISETRVGAITRAEQLEEAAQAARLAFGLVSAGGAMTGDRLSPRPWHPDGLSPEESPPWSLESQDSSSGTAVLGRR
jgi:aspartate kinase